MSNEPVYTVEDLLVDSVCDECPFYSKIWGDLKPSCNNCLNPEIRAAYKEQKQESFIIVKCINPIQDNICPKFLIDRELQE